MKTVLTIAGSDCSGGAGVQADLKTMAAHGVFGMSVIVSVVAENTARVIDIQDISPRMIEEQIDAVFEDIVPDAVKIGMLSSPECMKAVAGKLAQYKPAHIVIDPVMFAKNGDPLMDPASVGTLIETVLPFAEVLTPNVPEAQYLADMEIRTPEDMEEAARRIYAKGCKNVLVKGGKNIAGAVDVLFDGETCHRIEIEQIDTTSTHGTGCTLSSAIASNLALGHSVPEAVKLSKEYVTDAIRHAPGLGHGCGPLNHCRRSRRSCSRWQPVFHTGAWREVLAGAAYGKCTRRRSAGPVVRARHGLCSSTDSQRAGSGQPAGVPRLDDRCAAVRSGLQGLPEAAGRLRW